MQSKQNALTQIYCQILLTNKFEYLVKQQILVSIFISFIFVTNFYRQRKFPINNNRLQILVFIVYNNIKQLKKSKVLVEENKIAKMGSCLKSKHQEIEIPIQKQKIQKPSRIPEEKGLQNFVNIKQKFYHQMLERNSQYSIQFQSTRLVVATSDNQIVKIGSQYQALLPTDPQFNKVVPPVMIDVSQLKEKDKFGQKKYTIHINQFPKISKPFWFVVKSLPGKKYQLKQGDVFKMGKIKIRVKQIIHQNSEVKDMNKQIVQAQYKVYDCLENQCQGQAYDKDLKCRICMQEGQTQNPLISICDCIGSAKYTHFKCLRQWFTIQLQPTKINCVTEVNWKSLQCELCKARLPYSIILDNQTYFLVSFPKMKKPYLVLNPVYKSNNQKSKIYYFISFKKRNRMIVGRKSDADIQLCSDATISRNHSVIEYVQGKGNDEGKFYLQDCNSKFGTVVLLNTKSTILVDPKLHGVQFQVGGDLIRINYKTEMFFQTMSTKQDEIDFNCNSQLQQKIFQQESQNKQIQEMQEMQEIQSQKPSQGELKIIMRKPFKQVNQLMISSNGENQQSQDGFITSSTNKKHRKRK